MAEFVKDVMTPGVVAVRPDASVVEAARLMRGQNIGDVVVADGQHVVGVVTDRDITVRAVAEGRDPYAVSVGSVCTPDPLTLAPDDPVASAVTLMREHAVRRIPVVEGGLPVGLVTLGDLAEARDPGSALADISRADPDDTPDASSTTDRHRLPRRSTTDRHRRGTDATADRRGRQTEADENRHNDEGT